MQELFELFGELGIKTQQAFRQIDNVERRVRELANQFSNDLTADITLNDHASDGLDHVGSEAELARRRLNQLEDVVRQVESDLANGINADINIADGSVVRARNDLQMLMREIDRIRTKVDRSINIDANVDSNGPQTFPQTSQQPQNQTQRITIATNMTETRQQVGDLERELTSLRDELQSLSASGINNINFRGLQTNVDSLISPLQHVETELERIQSQVNHIDGSHMEIDGTVSMDRQTQYNGLNSEIQGLRTSIAGLAAATLASRNGTGLLGGRGQANMGYDANRVFQQQMRMNQMMLRYSQMLNPENLVGRVREKLETGSMPFSRMKHANGQLEMQALFGMANSGIMTARRQLGQLGFGRTKTEAKAVEMQMHAIANIQMDNLRDQIKLTEKALKEMKGSANSHELTDDIARAEHALKDYKNQLKDANPVKQLGRVNGYNVEKIFGKDVFVKPFKSQLDRIGGHMDGFFNGDLPRMFNSAYQRIDGAATKIVGDQGTKMETKAKIAQLQMKYQTLGMQINTFVTPAVLGLGAAFGMLGNAAEKGNTAFQAMTLTSNKDMGEFKNQIEDASVATGESQEKVGQLFATLKTQMGYTKSNIKDAATMGLYFKKVWGTDAAKAVGTVDQISKQLGVSQGQARDIFAQAMVKYQGDIKQATKDVQENGKAWKEATKAGADGAGAYKKMVDASNNGAMAQGGIALRQMGAALLELWKQLEPTVISVAQKITKVAKATTQWLRNNPGMAKMIAHGLALAGAMTILVGALAPVAGFLIMHRGLFQGLGQAMTAAGRGGTAVFSPAVKMVMDSLLMTKNAITGLPRVIGGAIPALLGMLRSLPGALGSWVVGFVKMNPLLTAFSAIAWVAYKNWDRVGPLLGKIWSEIKRIIAAIVNAFAGPGKEGMNAFSEVMNKLAGVAGDVLVKALEALIPVLDLIAKMMEGGGGKIVATAGAFWLLGGAAAKVVPGLGGITDAFGKITDAIGMFKKVFGVLPMLMTKMGPLLSKLPIMFSAIGSGLSALGPLFLNPWTWVILAIVGIGILIWKNWDKIKEVSIKILTAMGKGIIAAWNATVRGFAAAGKGIGKFFSGMWNGVKHATESAFKGISSFLRNHWKTILAVITGPIGILVLLISKNWNSIKSVTQRVWRSITSFLRNNWKTILTVITGPIGWLVGFIARNWNSIKSTTQRVWRAIASSLRSIWNSIRNTTRSVVNSIRNFVVSAWNNLKNRVVSITNSMKNAIISAWNRIKSFIKSAATAIKNAVVNAFNKLKNAAISASNAMRNGVRNAFNAILNAARAFGTKLKHILTNAWSSLKGMAKSAWGWGKNIVEGLIGGITSMAHKVVKAVKGIANKIKHGITNALGIHSPSRVMMGYGVNVGQGLAIGIGNMVKTVGRASNELAGAIQPPKPITASVNVTRNISDAMSPMMKSPTAKVGTAGSVQNNNTTNSNTNNGVTIQRATFELKIEKLQSAEDVGKLRKVIQNVVSNDLFGMAVRNV